LDILQETFCPQARVVQQVPLRTRTDSGKWPGSSQSVSAHRRPHRENWQENICLQARCFSRKTFCFQTWCFV